MRTILISLIGKGSINDKNEGKGYMKVTYRFGDGQQYDTAFFGTALYRHLKNKGYDIKKWLIFGTDTSMWSEIIDAVDSEKQGECEDLYCRVNEEEKHGITSETLMEWQECIAKSIPGTNLIKVDA